jgi:hypothetical protein
VISLLVTLGAMIVVTHSIRQLSVVGYAAGSLAAGCVLAGMARRAWSVMAPPPGCPAKKIKNRGRLPG